MHDLVESVKLRFQSGNNVEVERARVSYEELKQLIHYLEMLYEKVKRRAGVLAELTQTESTSDDLREVVTEQFNSACKLIDREIAPAFGRRDGVVKRSEIMTLLHTLTLLELGNVALKVQINTPRK